MSPRNLSSTVAAVRQRSTRIDMLAIGIALALAMLVRFNVIPGVGW